MSLVTADVIVRTILSRPLDPREARTIFAAFARYQRRASLVMVLRFLRLPKPWLQRLLRNDAGLIRSWIAAAISERSRCQPGLATGSNPVAGHQDLLAALERAQDRPDTPTGRYPAQAAEGAAETPGDPLAGLDEGSRGFSQEELVDQVCVLFLAGHETSASALAMACYLLARYPEAQARFAKEIEQVRGGTPSPESDPSPHRPLDYEDLRSLPYGAALLQETLRLYPPLSFFIRESQAASQLGESRCPMGALLAISPWVIQRHEQHWSEPNRFRPERFLADQASDADKQWARDAFLPFGLGPRKCPGAAFALQEALLVLAELVSRYELLGEPGQEPELVGNLTLRSRNGVQLRLRRRA
jgi:cytochrome P450